MTIHGGGKLPSSARNSSPDAGAPERPRRAAEKRQAREAGVEQAPTRRDVGNSAPTPAHGVAVAGLTQANQTSPGIRLDELMANPSQIKQMAEAIGAHARRLAGEFDGLRNNAQAVVGRLAQTGFAPEAVAGSREELGNIRKQMAGLRGKIAADHRRLKLLKVAAHRLGESKLTDKVSGQLRKVADMEKGWGRAFLALGIAGTFGHSPAEGAEQRPTRVPVGSVEPKDRHDLGNHLAGQAPGTAASQLMVALLEEGPMAPSGRLVAEAYAELHADLLAGRFGKSLQGLGLWRQAMG
jgi:hypothetical protein